MRLTLRSVAAACVLAAAIQFSTPPQAIAANAVGDCTALPGIEDGPPPLAGPAPGLRHPPGLPWGGHPASLIGGPVPPWMHGLHLSETQQDAVFGILHAREPALRDQFKAVRSSRDALRKAALTSGTEAEQLRLLGDAAGKADADLAVLMAQTDQRLLQLLTADQQRALQDCLAR